VSRADHQSTGKVGYTVTYLRLAEILVLDNARWELELARPISKTQTRTRVALTV
jgi:hypothetical protein